MPIDTLRRIVPVPPRLAPVFCFILLVASCALASLALACATPFAAFAVLAAAMMPLSSALAVIGAAWIVNQSIGFGLLHYPMDPKTLFWGAVIGLAALAATFATKIVLRVLSGYASAIAIVLALVGAYGAYELVLFAATPFLGGSGSFTAAIIARLGLLNALWLIGLIAASAATTLMRRFREARAIS